MKPLRLLPLSLLSLALPLCGGVALMNLSPTATFAASSSYPKASLPTTIDLNPVPEAEVRAYYSGLSSLPEAERKGTNLLKNLKPILMDGQSYFSYDINSGADIWKIYEITDRDWDLSPASAITQGTYNPSTNTITNYKYGVENPYVHALYRNRGVEKARQKANEKHGKDGGIDREHIWPKSRGFDTSGGSGARGDIMHLWPGDHPVNSYAHVNNPYGFVDPKKVSKDMGAEYKTDGVVTLAGNYLGTSSSLGVGKVFEPQDSDKGDIARAVFYMAARYNNWSMQDTTIDAGNPNLFLDDSIDTETVASTADKAVSIGLIRDLLAWHHLDPVDEFEIRRNDLVFRNYNHNRNPFIDFPCWADDVWGSSVYDEAAHKVSSFDPTPLGQANPGVDNVYSFKSPAPIVSIRLKDGYKTEYAFGESFVKPTVLGKDEEGLERDVTASCAFSGFDSQKEGEQVIKVTYSSSIELVYAIHVAPKPATPWYLYLGIAAGALLVLLAILIGATSKNRKSRAKSASKGKKKASSKGKKRN